MKSELYFFYVLLQGRYRIVQVWLASFASTDSEKNINKGKTFYFKNEEWYSISYILLPSH